MIIKVQCPDRIGIIRDITTLIAHYHGNISRYQEYVHETGFDEKSANTVTDKLSNKIFFCRIECQFPIIQEHKKEFYDVLENELIELLEKEISDNQHSNKQQKKTVSVHCIDETEKKNIILLCGKEYQCPVEVLLKSHFGDLNAKVVAVISSSEHLKGLVEHFNIPFHYISHQRTKTSVVKSQSGFMTEAHEHQIQFLINQYEQKLSSHHQKLDYIVLAKYLWILSPLLVNLYAEKLVNIHHSFLPSFKGANPYQQAINKGVKIIGATCHFVTQELDEGPIITQKTLTMEQHETLQEVILQGRDVEKSVLINGLMLLCLDHVFIQDNRTIILN